MDNRIRVVACSLASLALALACNRSGGKEATSVPLSDACRELHDVAGLWTDGKASLCICERLYGDFVENCGDPAAAYLVGRESSNIEQADRRSGTNVVLSLIEETSPESRLQVAIDVLEDGLIRVTWAGQPVRTFRRVADWTSLPLRETEPPSIEQRWEGATLPTPMLIGQWRGERTAMGDTMDTTWLLFCGGQIRSRRRDGLTAQVFESGPLKVNIRKGEATQVYVSLHYERGDALHLVYDKRTRRLFEPEDMDQPRVVYERSACPTP